MSTTFQLKKKKKQTLQNPDDSPVHRGQRTADLGLSLSKLNLLLIKVALF